MIGLVIVSHGGLARAMLDTAAEIVGPFANAQVVPVHRAEPLVATRAKILAAVEQVGQGQGVLIIADMFGGTASNVALELVQAGGDRPRVEVLTGFNLAMLLKLSSAIKTAEEVGGLAQLLKSYGQRNIVVASDLLKERESSV